METIYIIIPIYNGEKYIERCLSSIFQQSCKNYQIICVNDGSTDRTQEILDSYKSDKVIVINKTNGGVSSARNAGLDYVNGKDGLITFVDIDDYIDTNYLANLLKIKNENKCDIVCCSYQYQFTDHFKPFIQTNEERLYSCFEGTNILLEDKTIQSHSHCKLYSANLWENVRFPLGIVSMEDQATIFKVFCKAKNGIFISNYPGYHYWQEGFSACRSPLSNKKIIDSLFGYYESCIYNFSEFKDDEKNILLSSSQNALSNVYLMTYPLFNKRKATNDQVKFFKKIKKYIKNNKLIKKFVPANKKERTKKRVYLYLRPFYRLLFKLYKVL